MAEVIRRRMRIRRARLIVISAILLFVLSISTLVHLFTDLLWYREVDLTSVFWTILRTKFLLAITLGLVFFAFCLGNLIIVGRIRPRHRLVSDQANPLTRYRTAMEPYLKWAAIGGSAFLAFLFGIGVSSVWDLLVLALNKVPFHQTDPVFHKDIAFYVFRLPFYRFVYGWFFSMLLVVTVLVAAAHYLSGGIRPLPKGDRVSPAVKAHLSVLIGLISLLKAWGYRLDQFNLLYSGRGNITGATYTDVHAQLPALRLLVVISVIGAVLFLVNIRFKGWALPVAGAGLWALTSLLAGGLYPFLVQRFVVDPNQLQKERPYLRLHIDATRAAYGVSAVAVKPYSATSTVSRQTVDANTATVSNIRLWDTDTLKRAYQSLQEIRPYYQFQDVDVDRYMIGGQPRQVMLSTRELSADNLLSQTWQNQHLFYTHGYGAVVSAASEATPEGEPRFLSQDIPPKATAPELALSQPSVYFGDALSGIYSVAPSAQKELDYGKPDGDQLTTYSGKGGVALSGFMRRLAFAWRFRDANLGITGLVKPDSKILFYRQIRERLLKAAPFLHFDTDPYPAIVDGRIVWIADAYTASDMYPYSERLSLTDRTTRHTADGDIASIDEEDNYVRNSVKATVDAYDGTVSLYVWDPADPIIQAWMKAFPGMFRGSSEMPDGVRAHIRYPEDLFHVQTDVYRRYHMTDTTEFFTNEDQWVIPPDPNAGGQTQTATDVSPSRQGDEVQPYYVLMRLPGSTKVEYVLILPMNPGGGKLNMAAWLAAKSGPDEYGQLIDFRFPKGSQVDGVAQVHARINTTPEISQEVSLLDQHGSKVVFGNLLVIPLDDSILYVQPMFVQGQKNAIPELKNVILASSKKVVMASTMSDALGLLLQGGPVTIPTTPSGPAGQSLDAAARSALAHLQAADDAARKGDWATYGQEQEAARKALEGAVAQPTPTPTPTPK